MLKDVNHLLHMKCATCHFKVAAMVTYSRCQIKFLRDNLMSGEATFITEFNLIIFHFQYVNIQCIVSL